jgi:hypothetical protein
VLQHEGEGVPGGLAEVVVGEGNLNVGVFGHVLDTLFHGPEEVAGHADDGLNQFGLGHGLDLLTVVLEQEANHLGDSDAESTESDGAKMVPQEPVVAAHDGAFALGVGVALEVPDAGGRANDELSAADDEGVNPEEAENVVEENVASLIGPLHLRHELVSGTGNGIADGEDEHSGAHPDAEPQGSDNSGPGGECENLHVSLNVMGSGLENSDSEFHSVVAAGEKDEGQCGKTPESVRCVFEVLVSRVGDLIGMAQVKVGVESATSETEDKQEKGDPDNGATN